MNEKFSPDTVIGKLGQIEELWEKLLHVKWNREGFVALTQAVQDTAQFVSGVAGQEQLAGLLAQLEQPLSVSLNAGHLPSEREKERVQTLLRALKQMSPSVEPTVSVKTRGSNQLLSREEILLVAAENSWELTTALQSAGLRIRHLSSLAEVRAFLARAVPAAAIVDMDCQAGALLAGINMIAKDSERIDFNASVFFISERADLLARLEAVSAGGEGYFTKPIDIPLLSATLSDQLSTGVTRRRVLIVDDTAKEAREMALILEARGILTQELDKPMEVIQALYRYQPDLVLLNLDLREVGGLELVKAIRQNSDFDSLPMIVLSVQADLNQRLIALSAGADDLLGKPVNAELLFKAVNYRVRRARNLTQKLASLKHRDTISGLYNRRYFLMQLQQLLAGAEMNAGSVAVMLITLDNLRAVAAMNMAACDDVVEQAADRLRMTLAPGQQAARFGDATFAVLDNAGDHREALLDSARKMRMALEANPYRVGKEQVQLRISIGISIAEKGKQDILSLIQQADLACSSAWVAGGEHIQLYYSQTEPRLQAPQEKSLLEEIREAVKQQRMSLVFQPIASMQGDTVERYEVLLRLYKEGQEIVPEAVFEATQRYRLGRVLDRWVIAQSIRVLKERQGYGHSTTLFINISPAILQDEEFFGWLQGGLEKTGVPPERLIFELAEATAERHMQELREFLDKLKPLGCGFSLDRFAGQEHSLEVLKVLPVDYVKLDAIFAQDLAEDKHKQQQLKALAQQLSTLKVTAVASSIEKLPTLFALWSCGIGYVQGFFLQRPQEEMNYDFTSGAF